MTDILYFYGCNFFFNSENCMKIDELVVKLDSYVAQTNKVFLEITGLITDMQAQIASLNDALTNVTLPPEAVSAITALGVSLQTLDDVVPDPIEPPEEPEEPVDPE
jgi:hypothetical protein